MIIADDFRLPRVDEPPPNLALMVLGRALAETFKDATDGPLPEKLARIVQDLERREADRHARS